MALPRFIRGAGLFILTSSLLSAQTDLSCDPSTPVAKQSRTDMKHRKPASKGTQVEQSSISDVLGFDTPDDIRDKATRISESPIDGLEDEVLELEGTLWRVAREANDCDYHLELSAPGKGKAATRVIAEIPDDAPYAGTRQALLAALDPADRQKLMDSGDVTLSKPVNLRLTGFAFFDAFHYALSFNAAKPGRCKFTKAQMQLRGKNHGTCAVGTLWELHPTWKLEIVGAQ
jgi:hypothetical protein